MPDARGTSAGTWTLIAYAFPPTLAVAMAAVYLLWPDFYQHYVLNEAEREMQFVELATEALAFIASFILMGVGIREWKAGTAARRQGRARVRPGLKGLLDGRGGAAVLLFIAAGTFFFAGEEISWGQTFFGWESELRETNLHNTVPISFSGLGTLILVILMIGLPLAWHCWPRAPLTDDVGPAIAEGPVIACLMIGMIVSLVKAIMIAVDPDHELNPHYQGFIDQVHEQKELFFALAMFIYALYSIRRGNLPPPRRCLHARS